MICPHCGWDNLPGNELCSNCQQDLTPLDRPVANSRVERSLMEDTVASMGVQPATTLTPDRPVREAIALMQSGNVGAVLVVDDAGMLVGIFSERDLLKKIAGLEIDYSNVPVMRFMTAKPETVTSSDTLAYVLSKMDGGGYRHLPVVEHERPLGVISVRDMLRHITTLCKP